MKRPKGRTAAQQAEPVRDLIKHARQRDALGKRPASRAELIDALMLLGRDRKSAERAVENARVRVRRAANKPKSGWRTSSEARSSGTGPSPKRRSKKCVRATSAPAMTMFVCVRAPEIAVRYSW